jgi:hypothetical protein
MTCAVCDDLGCEFCPKVDPYELAISMGVELVESGPLEPFSARAAALALSESFPEIETERIQYGIAGRIG